MPRKPNASLRADTPVEELWNLSLDQRLATLRAKSSTTSLAKASRTRSHKAAKATSARDYPQVEFARTASLRTWLAKNHAKSTGIWAVTRKKSAGGVVAWNDIVAECICVGWVDSLPRKLDEARTMILITPRNPKSNWSAKNKMHAIALHNAGLLLPAGLAAIEAAKARGTWSALDKVSAGIVPEDLRKALQGLPLAEQHWNAFPPSTRRGILEWIETAKKPATRAVRVQETASLAAKNIRANSWRT
jgi:uncharacterized protein YdeI (YjbR/CyaY-like superfamily)